MRVERGSRTPPRRRPLLVEIIGPAAAGKTTLARALCAGGNGIHPGMRIGKLRHVGPSASVIGPLFVTWLRTHRDDRWLDRREMRWIARLETWTRAVERGRAGDGAIVLDHGPLFRLASLREFGPSITQTDSFGMRWREELEFWLDALTMVVSLDAPDHVLLRRVEHRGHWFLSGDHTDDAKREFLDRYRRAFDDVLASAPASLPIRRFGTDGYPTAEIAEAVLAAMMSVPSNRTPPEPHRAMG